jgi:hypothetical protein
MCRKPPTAFEWAHFFGSFLVAKQEMNKDFVSFFLKEKTGLKPV